MPNQTNTPIGSCTNGIHHETLCDALRLFVLTGAGISAESGLGTFRDQVTVVVPAELQAALYELAADVAAHHRGGSFLEQPNCKAQR